MGRATYSPHVFVLDGTPLVELCRSNHLVVKNTGLDERSLIEACFTYNRMLRPKSQTDESIIASSDDVLSWFNISDRLCDITDPDRRDIIKYNIHSLTDGLYETMLEMIDPIAVKTLGKIYFDSWLGEDVVVVVDT